MEINTFKYHASCTDGKNNVSEHVLNEGHEMKTIKETMSITQLENNHRK
jgi:hypothetical protein